ncbi:MAG TPA: 4-(cytidine 5'-diphospho)-2-C-methyl-D-erythritol kinase [Bacillota bacterium]|nr:4-(cytidine 5'-diphospho)-2-C-methyl-D-erythritol kinase [Bacillota bacterium]HOK68743.1 4-(cytidine 5'-diphospho)-2-C-methyl-D-erythritol kinase [Bacillota bacterium]HPP85612.1 4-(cytidine 5'-diphospho)-2-C-methyl-D-erythritol kinase [Bacillota bacterium]
MIEKAYAKINLTLDVTGKRADGYHEIRTVMQSVSLCDTISVERAEEITVSANKKAIPADKSNLAYIACEKFFEAAGIRGGANVYIKKHIPVAAGLAGGSTDAAAVLRALNRLYKTGFSTEELCEIGASFGADIPYCVRGGTALCEGIGEVITVLPKLPRLNIVISIGGEGMSTPVMYAEIDKRQSLPNIDTDGMVRAIQAQNISGIVARLGNVFEEICAEKRPFVSAIKALMLKNGALGAAMSGSGPSVFGVFSDKTAAEACAKLLKNMGYYAFHCTTV